VGNARTIHLNSYPGRYAARLDICDLAHINSSLPGSFIEKLLSQPAFQVKFKIEIEEESGEVGQPLTLPESDTVADASPGSRDEMKAPEKSEVRSKDKKEIKELNRNKRLLSKRLSSIYYENEDTFLEHGIKTFAFGYPSLIYRSQNDPAKIINAPILLWKLELQREKNEWIISRDEEFGISINDVLLNFLEQDLNTTGFFSLNDELLSDALIDKPELLKIINELTGKISNSAQKHETIPSSEYAIDKEKRSALIHSKGNPQIMFSGVFGLYKTQKEAIIKDVKSILQNIESFRFDYGDDSDHFQKVKYSAVETDPSQRQALKSVGNSKKLIIHGPPGTGKSQTLTAIIANALFNGAKCLVVCEKRTALEVIQKNLNMLGLGGFCGLIEDVNRDRKKIVDAVRDPRSTGRYVNENILNSLFEDTDVHISRVNANHKLLGRYILNDLTWSDIVGRFLQIKDANKNYLKLYDTLKNCSIDFRSEKLSEDFNSRLSAVKREQKLYEAVKSDVAVFRTLDDDLFRSGTSKEKAIGIGNSLKKLEEQLHAGISQLSMLFERYSAALTEHYDKYYTNFSSSIYNIAEIYNRNTTINRKMFTSLSGFTGFKLGIYSIFSKKYKQFGSDKEMILPAFNKLSEFTGKRYFNAELKGAVESLAEIEPQLSALKTDLENWNARLPQTIVDETVGFYSGNYNKEAFNEGTQLTSLEKELDELIAQMNSSNIFAGRIEFTDKPFSSKLAVLKGTVSVLKSILDKIENLYEYSNWRNDYLQNDGATRNIVNAMITSDSTNWEGDFETWYLFNILLAYEQEISLRDDNLLGSLEDNLEKISSYQVDVVKDHWTARQRHSAEKLEEKLGININTLYNKARNNKFQKRNSLRKIINTDVELFTDHFPVVLVNPTVCSSLFEMKEGLFDIVIFDEASQLRTEDVYAAKLRGRHRVVSGDENQMPPSGYFASAQVLIDGAADTGDDDDIVKGANTELADSESLLEFAIQRGYKETFLDIHYRSRHPDLIQFSNAAFYGSRLSPMPAAQDYKAMRFFRVNGVYDQEESINRDEAMKIAALIDELVITSKGMDNPSIGVATFNIFQRNHVLDLLNEKADRNSIFAEKLNILRNKPGESFFVKNLENIQGDERDIIIISTTFGRRTDGSFLQNFGPINQEKGYRLLNVIITRAKHMMIVCSSIPDEYIAEYPLMLETSGNRGKGIFYAFLAYAKSIESGDVKSKELLLNLLGKNFEEHSQVQRTSASKFEEVVTEALKKTLHPSRVIQNHVTGGFNIDIAVLPESLNGKMIAIECDGSNYHDSGESYAWDLFRKKFLKSFGFRFIRIWSVNWFNNPERELEKLLSFIAEPSSSNSIASTGGNKPQENN